MANCVEMTGIEEIYRPEHTFDDNPLPGSCGLLDLPKRLEEMNVSFFKSPRLPVTADMIKNVINRSTDEIQELDVVIADEVVTLSGKVEKKVLVRIPVHFTVTLRPSGVQGRVVTFDVVEVTPLNLGFVNKIIFSKPPYVSYDEGKVSIDFNAWEIVKKIPIGNIKSVDIQDAALRVQIGL